MVLASNIGGEQGSVASSRATTMVYNRCSNSYTLLDDERKLAQ